MVIPSDFGLSICEGRQLLGELQKVVAQNHCLEDALREHAKPEVSKLNGHDPYLSARRTH
jgi:hypothetical protein